MSFCHCAGLRMSWDSSGAIWVVCSGVRGLKGAWRARFMGFGSKHLLRRSIWQSTVVRGIIVLLHVCAARTKETEGNVRMGCFDMKSRLLLDAECRAASG